MVFFFLSCSSSFSWRSPEDVCLAACSAMWPMLAHNEKTSAGRYNVGCSSRIWAFFFFFFLFFSCFVLDVCVALIYICMERGFKRGADHRMETVNPNVGFSARSHVSDIVDRAVMLHCVIQTCYLYQQHAGVQTRAYIPDLKLVGFCHVKQRVISSYFSENIM